MMHAGDTSLGGSQKDFPETVWDLVSRARDPSDEVRRAALAELCRRYWKPVYYYLRVAWAKSNEDAKDLTQAFWLHVLESRELGRYTPERASFRYGLDRVAGEDVWDRNTYYAPFSGGTSKGVVGWKAWRSRTGADRNSTLVERAPAGRRVLLFPNKFERGRAHLGVFSRAFQEACEVDLAPVLQPGDRFGIYRLENLKGDPVVSETFSGRPIRLPLVASRLILPLMP